MKYTGKKTDIKYIKRADLAANEPEPVETTQEPKSRHSFWPGLNEPLRIIGLGAVLVMVVLSVIFMVLIGRLDVLPAGLFAALCAALLAFAVFAFFLWKSRRLATRIISLALAVIVSFVMGIGSYYVSLGEDTIESITGTSYSIKSYVVAVLADDPAQSLEDAVDYTFGTFSVLSGDEFSGAISELNEMAGKTLATEDHSTVQKLYEALMNGENEAIIYEYSLTSTFLEINEEYESQIRIIANVEFKSKTESKRTATKSDVEVTSEPFIIFISGNDQYGEEISTSGRSDVNILVAVNFVLHQVLMVVIPRDYYVPFPGITGGERDKLTHAGIYGIDVQLDTVDEIFGIDIDYYVKVNFTSLINIIDAVGGVDLYNPYGFGATYEDYYYPEGNIHLTGTEALFYARERKSIEGGDFARGEHQEIIIEALINQLVSVNSITHYTALMDALDSCAVTNMPKEKITSIVKKQLEEGSSWNIKRTQSLGLDAYQPSYAAGGMELCVVVPYAESVEKCASLINKIMSGILITDEDLTEPESYTLVTGLVDSEYSGGDYAEETEIDYDEIVETLETPAEETEITTETPAPDESDTVESQDIQETEQTETDANETDATETEGAQSEGESEEIDTTEEPETEAGTVAEDPESEPDESDTEGEADVTEETSAASSDDGEGTAGEEPAAEATGGEEGNSEN